MPTLSILPAKVDVQQTQCTAGKDVGRRWIESSNVSEEAAVRVGRFLRDMMSLKAEFLA